MGFHFEKLVQHFKLKRVGDVPKNYPFAPLSGLTFLCTILVLVWNKQNGPVCEKKMTVLPPPPWQHMPKVEYAEASGRQGAHVLFSMGWLPGFQKQVLLFKTGTLAQKN